MDEPEIKFGDKIFIYGRMTDLDIYEDVLDNPEYNTVMGYMPVGGFNVIPEKTPDLRVCLPGYVVESPSSSASQTLFAGMELVDVTELLTRQTPSLSGTKVWLPIPRLAD